MIGIDIPLLNNVIHYDFPDRPKLFVHRSGRAARAGRHGTSYSFLTRDDLPYLLDLQLFLGRSLLLSGTTSIHDPLETMKKDILIGDFPSSLYNDELESFTKYLSSNSSLESLKNVTLNAMKKYLNTRQSASPESYTRIKTILESAPIGSTKFGIHPIFADRMDEKESDRMNFLDKIRVCPILIVEF